MGTICKALIVCVFIQTTTCGSISLTPHEDTKSLTATTTELLLSFQNCIVYIFDVAYRVDYDSLASARYIQFYSKYMNCAVLVETYQQYRNLTFNKRFNIIEPHPLFTKHTKTLLNLYTPETTSTILKAEDAIDTFYDVLLFYNIPFNYVLTFMRNDEFGSIDNVGLFSKLAMISAPAVYLLILDEKEVNVISFGHAFQSAPYLVRVTEELQQAHIQQLHENNHKDLQGATARSWTLDTDSHICEIENFLMQHPNLCAVGIITKKLNITVLQERDHPYPQLSISELTANNVLDTDIVHVLSREKPFNLNLVNCAVKYTHFRFLCIAQVSKRGLMVFVQAYDLLTWIVTASACLCMTVTLAAMATIKAFTFWTNLQSSVPVIAMFLIERFYGHGQVIRFASRQIVLVITLWAFGAMLLGMCYSGNMVSELTSPSLSICPQDMQQLAAIEEYPILTNTWMNYAQEKKSIFHTQIHEYLEEYANTNGSLLSILRQLGKALTFVELNSTEIIPSNHNNRSKILLAYAGTTHAVSAYEMWRLTRSRKTRVLRGGNLPFFKHLTPICVTSNFLAPIFQRLLGSVCHCGMLRLWNDHLEAWAVNDIFELFGQSEKIEWELTWRRQSNLALIWRNYSPMIVGEATWSGMTLENLNAVFQFFGISMLLAICFFMKERRILTAAGHFLFQMAKNVPIVLSQIRDSF